LPQDLLAWFSFEAGFMESQRGKSLNLNGFIFEKIAILKSIF